MKRKHSLYSYEQSSEVAHLLPLRNNTKLNSRYSKLNTPAGGRVLGGGGLTEIYHGTSFDKVNRSTEFETFKFKRAVNEPNRISYQEASPISVNTKRIQR